MISIKTTRKLTALNLHYEPKYQLHSAVKIYIQRRV